MTRREGQNALRNLRNGLWLTAALAAVGGPSLAEELKFDEAPVKLEKATTVEQACQELSARGIGEKEFEFLIIAPPTDYLLSFMAANVEESSPRQFNMPDFDLPYYPEKEDERITGNLMPMPRDSEGRKTVTILYNFSPPTLVNCQWNQCKPSP